MIDGLGWLGQQPEVAAGRLGVVGISLGATLALHVAGDDERVRAVVDYFGPVPQHIEHARQMPPTLILHGGDDPLVSVENARSLSALLERRGVRYERVIYRGQGHGFHGAVDEAASQRCLVFLNRHLAAAGPAAVG